MLSHHLAANSPQIEANNSFLEMLKKKIFAQENERRYLMNKLSCNNFDEAFHQLFYGEEEIDLQKILAPLLRRHTIAYMRALDSKYAQDFAAAQTEIYEQRNDPSLRDMTDWETYLNVQEKNGTWATAAIAGGLADLLDITLVVTSITVGVASNFVLRKADVKGPTRPAIHLYVRDNNHWYCYEKDSDATLGDGNCFYNGVAQMLRQILILEEANKKKNEGIAHKDLPQAHQDAYQYQEELLAKIKDISPLSIKEVLQNVQKSITTAEQPDHEKALALALTFDFVKKPISSNSDDENENKKASQTAVDKDIKHFTSDADYQDDTPLIERPSSSKLFEDAVFSLQAQIDLMPVGKMKDHAQAIRDQAEAMVKIRPFSTTPILTKVLRTTREVLENPEDSENLARFMDLSNQVIGKPSLKMKVLGSLMITLGVLLATTAALVFVGTLGLGVAVSASVTAAAAVSVTTGAGFFNAGRRKGLSKEIKNLYEESMEASGCNLRMLKSH